MVKQTALAEYVPTPEQRRRWAREAREAAKFHVTYYRVWYEERVGGKATCTFPLSPPFPTPEKARNALHRLLKRCPMAHIVQSTLYFSKGRPEDVRARRELLAEMQ